MHLSGEQWCNERSVSCPRMQCKMLAGQGATVLKNEVLHCTCIRFNAKGEESATACNIICMYMTCIMTIK